MTVFGLSANEKLDKIVKDLAFLENDPVEVLISKEVETIGIDIATCAVIQLTETDIDTYYVLYIVRQNVYMYDCHENIKAAIDLYESCTCSSYYRVNLYDTDIHNGMIYRLYAVFNKD